MPKAPDSIPTLSWPDFLESFRWYQGEHLTAVGPTGCGKTTLVTTLLDRRSNVVAFGTKPADETLEKLCRQRGWRRIDAWPPPPRGNRTSQRIVLWPPYETPEDEYEQYVQLRLAMRAMFVQRGWTLFADELFYLVRKLGLQRELEAWWTQGRSIGLTLVGCTQRPAHVPLLAYDQATHLFFWHDSDETNLKRIGGLGGLSGQEIRRVVASLPHHDVLYVNTRDRQLIRTRVGR